MMRPEDRGGILLAGKPLRLLLPAALLLMIPLEAAGASAGDAPRREMTPRPAQLVLYCFHGQSRCFTCQKMEDYARDTVRENFADDLESGRIVFQAVDLAQPENRHFVADYQLDSWTVVLSLREEGKEVRFRKLSAIKSLVKDRAAFIRYLFGEVEAFLQGG